MKKRGGKRKGIEEQASSYFIIERFQDRRGKEGRESLFYNRKLPGLRKGGKGGA